MYKVIICPYCVFYGTTLLTNSLLTWSYFGPCHPQGGQSSGGRSKGQGKRSNDCYQSTLFPGCFLFFFLSKESESEVAQSCLTLRDPMNCSPPGSSTHWIFQARVLEWVAISFSRASSWPRDPTRTYHIVGRRFTVWVTREDSSFQFSCSVVSNSLQPHESQHARPPCP